MKKQVIGGFVTLGMGIVLTAFSFLKRNTLSADTVPDGVVQSVSISLYIGIALIILSAILFIRASGETKK